MEPRPSDEYLIAWTRPADCFDEAADVGTIGDLAGFRCVVGAPAPGTWRAEVALPGVLVAYGEDRLVADTDGP